MTYHVGIVAHVDRLTIAEQLADETAAKYISVDDGTLGCDGNHRKVWHWHHANTRTPWSVVLEDDACPSTAAFDWSDTVTAALNVAPSPVVSLYLGRSRPPHWQRRIARAINTAIEHDACWLLAHRMLHAVGIAIRTELIGDMLDHLAGAVHPIDQAIGDWATHRGHPVAYTLPSLVNHRDLPSVALHPDHAPRTRARTAWLVGDRDHWSPDHIVTM